MVNNSGPGIRSAADIITIVGIVITLILGLVIILTAEEIWILLLGIVFIIVNVFLTLFTGMCIRGFGEMVDNSYHVRLCHEQATKPDCVECQYKKEFDAKYENGAMNGSEEETVTSREIEPLMARYGISHAEAVLLAKKEQAAAPQQSEERKEKGLKRFMEPLPDPEEWECAICGAPIRAKDLFCQSCGVKLDS